MSSLSSSSKHRLSDSDLGSTSKIKKAKKEKSNSGSSSIKKDKKEKGKGKEKEKEERKEREHAIPQQGQAILRLDESNSDAIGGVKRNEQGVGPVLATFSGFEPPSAPFNLFNTPISWATPADFKRASAPGDSSITQAHPTDQLILQGETDQISYTSTNYAFGYETREYASDYLVGVHDPETSTITFKTAPFFTMDRTVKALATEPRIRKGPTGNMYEDRRALGETFGNRKQKLNARNQDRMKVTLSDDRNAESDATMNHVMSGIAEVTEGMQDAESVKTSADLGRNIPQPNLSASSPSEAYPLQSLIESNISSLLSKVVEPLYSPEIQSPKDLVYLLPSFGPEKSQYLLKRFYEASKRGRRGGGGFVAKKPGSNSNSGTNEEDFGIMITSTSKSEAKTRMRVLSYISLLWCFWKLNDKFKNGKGVGIKDKETFLQSLKLDNVDGGETILDDLFNRFTESQRGSKKPQFTSQKEALLLTTIFALCLHLDSYSVNISEISSEMNLDPTKASELFKALGCKPTYTSHSIVKDGKTLSERTRYMTLKVPIILPVPRKIPAKR